MFPGVRCLRDQSLLTTPPSLEINTCTFANPKTFGLPNAPHGYIRQAVRITAIKNRKIKLIFNKIMALQ